MTDAETYAAICADFPFDTATLQALHSRLQELLNKSRPNGWEVFKGKADCTIPEVDWKRLRHLTVAMRDLVDAMHMIETGGDPDDHIPF